MKTNFELLMSIKWYFEVKNFSLRKILEIKAPLSVIKQNELRLYYSQYFTSLLSATELLLDEKENNNAKSFKIELVDTFVFNNYIDGNFNYGYLRELRNSIIHRGMDLSSSAHFEEDFPLFLSPAVFNRSQNQEYEPFDLYLIQIIEKCELYIPTIIYNYLEKFNMLELEKMSDELLRESLIFLNNLPKNQIPNWVKKKTIEVMSKIDFRLIQNDSIKECVKMIKTNELNTL